MGCFLSLTSGVPGKIPGGSCTGPGSLVSSYLKLTDLPRVDPVSFKIDSGFFSPLIVERGLLFLPSFYFDLLIFFVIKACHCRARQCQGCFNGD